MFLAPQTLFKSQHHCMAKFNVFRSFNDGTKCQRYKISLIVVNFHSVITHKRGIGWYVTAWPHNSGSCYNWKRKQSVVNGKEIPGTYLCLRYVSLKFCSYFESHRELEKKYCKRPVLLSRMCQMAKMKVKINAPFFSNLCSDFWYKNWRRGIGRGKMFSPRSQILHHDLVKPPEPCIEVDVHCSRHTVQTLCECFGLSAPGLVNMKKRFQFWSAV